jgi:hypothetical protein
MALHIDISISYYSLLFYRDQVTNNFQFHNKTIQIMRYLFIDYLEPHQNGVSYAAPTSNIVCRSFTTIYRLHNQPKE